MMIPEESQTCGAKDDAAYHRRARREFTAVQAYTHTKLACSDRRDQEGMSHCIWRCAEQLRHNGRSLVVRDSFAWRSDRVRSRILHAV